MSTQWVSDRINSLVPSATISMDGRIRRLRETGHEVTNLISGAPEFDTPAEIKAAARSALDEAYRYMTYTDSAGLLELRQAIAAKLTRGKRVRRRCRRHHRERRRKGRDRACHAGLPAAG